MVKVQRVGINAHLLSGEAGYRQAGIHHYIRQLLRHLPADDDRVYRVYSGPAARTLLADAPVSLAISRWPTERRLLRIAWEQTVWPLQAVRDGVDLLHALAFVTPLVRLRPSVVTVFDLSFLHFPDRFPPLQQRYLAGQSRRSVRGARRVVAISRAGKEDIVRFFGVAPERVDIVYPGVDDRFRPQPPEAVAAFRARRGLPERFVLHVGTLQPRKNLLTLIDAFARLGRPDLHLLLVGGRGWLYDELFARVAALGLQDQVHFTGYVPDEELPLWYSAAALFVFPSLYEGFGMPIIEALACGTPVVAADSAALREAAGAAVPLFPPTDAAALADQMANVLDHSAVAATIRSRGLIHARQFSWSTAGSAQAAVYERARSPQP